MSVQFFLQQTSRLILSRQVFNEHDIVDVSVQLFYIYIRAIRCPNVQLNKNLSTMA